MENGFNKIKKFSKITKPKLVSIDRFYKYAKVNIDKLYIDRYNLNDRVIGDVVKLFYKKIAYRMLYDSYVYNLKYGMFKLLIIEEKKYLPLDKDGNINFSKMSVDWGNTIKLWNSNPVAKEAKKRIYYTNTSMFKLQTYLSNRNTNSVYYHVQTSKPYKEKIAEHVSNKGRINVFPFIRSNKESKIK